MHKLKDKPKASDILRALNGLWVNKQGIMTIAFCGDTKAGSDMRKIAEIVKEKYNKTLPKGLVPTEEVIDYYNININYLKKISNLDRSDSNEKTG